jgi:hypothetical protein
LAKLARRKSKMKKIVRLKNKNGIWYINLISDYEKEIPVPVQDSIETSLKKVYGSDSEISYEEYDGKERFSTYKVTKK